MNDKPEQYYLFLDECGDQNLSNFDPSFPVFTLCGIIVSEENLYEISLEINKLKKELWGEGKIILHSRDIRKCQNGFENLFDLEVKKYFYEQLNTILGQDKYTIISCTINKEQYIRKYGRLNDVYSQSLSFIIERTVFYLDGLHKNIKILIDAEKRGKKEDNRLLKYFNMLLDRGTYFVTPQRLQKYRFQFGMHSKKENIIGLQLADLVAYPVTRYILDKKAVNKSFEIIKRNIYTDERGKMHGLKEFP